MPANLENSAVGTGLERPIFIAIPKKGNAKKCSNYHTIALISHTSKVILKILQARLHQYVICGLPDFQAGFEKAENPEIKLWISAGSSKKQESSRKTSISALLTMPKPLTVWITTNCGKFLKRWVYQTTIPASWDICMQVRKQHLEPDIEQQTVENSSRDGNTKPPDLHPEISVCRSGSNSRTGHGTTDGFQIGKAVYSHHAYLTYMQNTWWEMLGCMKHKLESRLPGKISITWDMQMTPPSWHKVKKN